MNADRIAEIRAQIRANEDAAAFYGGTPNRIILDPDTVRALCDATDEVERLRGDRDALREQVQRLRASRESNRGGWARTLTERDALRAAVDRVRALGERDGRDLLAAWLASNGVEQPDTVAVEAAAFVLTALESGNYGTPEWFNSIDKPLFPEGEVIREATDASRTAHAALDAELRALHAPRTQVMSGSSDPKHVPMTRQVCSFCGDNYGNAPYPCATVTALDRHAPTTGETP